MKYFVISDVHGFYDEMIDALNKAGFDRNSPEHTLISCGDNFDRGGQSIQVWNFLMSLERKVLVKGNHESLLEELIFRSYFEKHDILNGTADTANAFMDYYNLPDCRQLFPILKPYFHSLVDYFETDNYIFVHSWIPEDAIGYSPSWRDAAYADWERARWGNPFEKAVAGLNKTGKTIVFGHWHTSWMQAFKSQLDNGSHYTDAKTSARYNRSAFQNDIYYGDRFIGIDACTVRSKQVNVLIIKD